MANEPNMNGTVAPASLPDGAIAALDTFRHALRQYMAFSDALLAGLKLGPRRYQAMLAIKAREASGPITIGMMSRLLLIRPNSATELVTRLERAGLVERLDDPNDRRRQLVRLTPEGDAKINEAASLHYAKIQDHHHAFLNLFNLEESQWNGREAGAGSANASAGLHAPAE